MGTDEAGIFLLFRLARSRSPKPPGFGAGEVQRKCGPAALKPSGSGSGGTL
jgi:hypothetical protein